ncbi:hypothetical protein [Streptomyces griseoaurantiacus]|uniref:hypothetical protein n=1 Tax=Streptomyces griseoaurantiacus TaxID=68213 RepID=UPI003244EC15
MDAALAGIIGAAVGACGTALAAGVTGYFTRSQALLQVMSQRQQVERQIRADLAAQMREPRRQAYASYATEVSGTLDALWWAASALSESPPRPDAALEHMRAFRPSSSQAIERVFLEGPEEVASAAAELAGVIAGASHIAFVWIAHQENESQDEDRDYSAELQQALEAAKRARDAFRLLAMDTVRAGGEHPETEEAVLRTAAIGEWVSNRRTDAE